MGLRGAWDSLVTCLANENFMSGKSAQVEHLQWTVSEKNWHTQLWLKCCGRQKKLIHFSYYKPVWCFCAWYICIRLGFSSRFELLYHKYFYWNMWRILLRSFETKLHFHLQHASATMQHVCPLTLHHFSLMLLSFLWVCPAFCHAIRFCCAPSWQTFNSQSPR